MYDKLKLLQPVAEQIGKVEKLTMHKNEEYFPDSVKYKGVTDDGKEWELELTIKEKSNADP